MDRWEPIDFSRIGVLPQPEEHRAIQDVRADLTRAAISADIGIFLIIYFYKIIILKNEKDNRQPNFNIMFLLQQELEQLLLHCHRLELVHVLLLHCHRLQYQLSEETRNRIIWSGNQYRMKHM